MTLKFAKKLPTMAIPDAKPALPNGLLPEPDVPDHTRGIDTSMAMQ